MKYTYPLNGQSLVLDSERCTGCGRCLDVCPHGVYARQSGLKQVAVVSREQCMECGACALNCPVHAISVNRGVGCAAAIIGSMLGKKGECSCGTDCC